MSDRIRCSCRDNYHGKSIYLSCSNELPVFEDGLIATAAKHRCYFANTAVIGDSKLFGGLRVAPD